MAGMLKNIWFPAGGRLQDFSVLDAYGIANAPVTDAVVNDPLVAARCALVTAPDGSGDTVARFTRFVTDPTTGAGPKVQLAPGSTTVSPTVYDPITNWAGSTDGVLNANSRRWYRFKFMLPSDFVFEEWSGGSQRLVVFQIHDRTDTSPADVGHSPPLWLIVNADHTFSFSISSSAAADDSGFVVRDTARIKVVPGVPVEIVLYIKWAWDNTGALTIWRDRRKIWDEAGKANCFNNATARGGSGNHAILACYTPADLIDRTVYHWGLQIGDETYANYAAFAAAAGAGPELERVMAAGVSVE